MKKAKNKRSLYAAKIIRAKELQLQGASSREIDELIAFHEAINGPIKLPKKRR